MIKQTEINPKISIEIKRYPVFAGIKITLPTELQFLNNYKRNNTIQWIIPNRIMTQFVKIPKDILLNAKRITPHNHKIISTTFIQQYKSGYSMRYPITQNPFEDVDTTNLTDEQINRIFQLDDDNWLKKDNKIENRLIQTQIPTTKYGKAETIKEIARQHHKTVIATIENNNIPDNIDILGRQTVWITTQLDDTELQEYLNKHLFLRDRYIIEEILGIQPQND